MDTYDIIILNDMNIVDKLNMYPMYAGWAFSQNNIKQILFVKPNISIVVLGRNIDR